MSVSSPVPEAPLGASRRPAETSASRSPREVSVARVADGSCAGSLSQTGNAPSFPRCVRCPRLVGRREVEHLGRDVALGVESAHEAPDLAARQTLDHVAVAYWKNRRVSRKRWYSPISARLWA